MKSSNLKIKIVDNHEEQLKANLVRAIVYMHEQNCPYEEEFDLNDFTATQIIGLLDNEPILTARIRYFGDFVKFERLAIRSQFRGMKYGHMLLQFMLDVAEQKGFSKCYLHAQKRLQSFYEGYGFEVVGNEFNFSDHDYIEMVNTFHKSAAVFEIGDNPHLINRPEGQWNLAGPIEQSLNRTNHTQVSYLGRG